MKKAMKVLGCILGVILLIAILAGGYLVLQLRKQLRDGGKIVEWNDSYGTIYRDLRYGDGSRHTFNLIIPAHKHPSAVMLFLHGGSWTSGEKEDMEYEAYRYAKQRYATAVMNYSRLGVDTLDYTTQYRQPNFQSMMQEITMAIEAIKREGATRGCDFTQMAIGGYSAGGHLAMLYATRHAAEAAIPIRFQISWVGPSDLNILFPTSEEEIANLFNNPTQENQKQIDELRHFLHHIVGRDLSPEELRSEGMIGSIKSIGSPLHHVSAATPPAILAYGGADRLVDKEHGNSMATALNVAGVENKLFIFPNSGHVLGQDPDLTEQVNLSISDFCNRYFE